MPGSVHAEAPASGSATDVSVYMGAKPALGVVMKRYVATSISSKCTSAVALVRLGPPGEPTRTTMTV